MQPAAASPAVPGPSALRILLVDDNAALLDGLSTMLRLRVPLIEVGTAESVPVGLELMEHLQYDVVVTDLKMAGMDGLSFVQQCRARWPQTPIIMLTAAGDADLGARAMNAGAYGYVEKPLDREQFVALVRQALDVHMLRVTIAAEEAWIARLLEQRGRYRGYWAKASEAQCEHISGETDEFEATRHLLSCSVRLIERYGHLIERQLQTTQSLLSWHSDRLLMMEARERQNLPINPSTRQLTNR